MEMMKYETKGTVDPKDNYLLDCFIEECAEAIKAATKIKRFGWDNSSPFDARQETNLLELSHEINDVFATVQMLRDNCSRSSSIVPEQQRMSRHRREMYQQMMELGLVSGE